MSFVICRVKKIKSKQSLRNSLKHNLREQETKNADPKLTHKNQTRGVESSSEGVAFLTKRLAELTPPKRKKKDRVLAIEYLLTASPEFFEEATDSEKTAYLNDCLTYLKDKHGRDNLISVAVHMDEKTPHIHVHFVPVVDNKLDAKNAIGGPAGLRKLQTEMGAIGNKYGLMRGIRGSKAKHQTVRAYYSKLKGALRASQVTKWELIKHELGFPQKSVKNATEGFQLMRMELTEAKSKNKKLERGLDAANREKTGAIMMSDKLKSQLNDDQDNVRRLDKQNEEIELLRSELATAQAVIKKHDDIEKRKITDALAKLNKNTPAKSAPKSNNSFNP